MTKKTTASKRRYGCVKRVYVTKIRGHRATKETSYELVEVYDGGKSWTADAVVVTAESKQGLILALTRAAMDVANNEAIVEPKHLVRSFP